MEQPKAKENTNAKIPIYLIIKNALSKDFFFLISYGRYAPEGRAQKFHTDDVSLPWNEVDLGFLLDEANFQLMRHNLDLRIDTSSVWNFCACSLDVISRGNQR